MLAIAIGNIIVAVIAVIFIIGLAGACWDIAVRQWKGDQDDFGWFG